MPILIFDHPPRIIKNENIKQKLVVDNYKLKIYDHTVDNKSIALLSFERATSYDGKYIWKTKLEMLENIYTPYYDKEGWALRWVKYLYLDNICGGWLSIADEKRLKKILVVKK
jgi:hypothetical protein